MWCENDFTRFNLFSKKKKKKKGKTASIIITKLIVISAGSPAHEEIFLDVFRVR